MNIIAIIQARTGSTRLPKKVLLDLEGKTVLERVIERVQACRLINGLVVATTVSKYDLEIVKLCANIGVSVYCGSEDDVLDRFYQTAKLFQADHIIRITADCPLVDPRVIGIVIEKHLKEEADYTSNTLKETYPDGEDVEIFTFNALKKAWRNADLNSEREHVTPYIRKNASAFKLTNVEYKENMSAKRWTLDNSEDYEFIKKVYKNLYYINPLFGMQDVLKYIEKTPEVESINNEVRRNEGYHKSLREDRRVGQRDK